VRALEMEAVKKDLIRPVRAVDFLVYVPEG
jgi:hypothetical protein